MKDVLSVTAKIGAFTVDPVHSSAIGLARGVQVAPLPGE